LVISVLDVLSICVGTLSESSDGTLQERDEIFVSRDNSLDEIGYSAALNWRSYISD
jgi:hypothetical protein